MFDLWFEIIEPMGHQEYHPLQRARPRGQVFDANQQLVHHFEPIAHDALQLAGFWKWLAREATIEALAVRPRRRLQTAQIHTLRHPTAVQLVQDAHALTIILQDVYGNVGPFRFHGCTIRSTETGTWECYVLWEHKHWRAARPRWGLAHHGRGHACNKRKA